MTTPDARDLWHLLEPVHTVTYFSPEPLDALREAGYRGFWMGYFAGRSAPLGEAGPDVVQALFYNFTHAHVARALPDAWQFAPPAAALAARLRGSAATLRRTAGGAVTGTDVERTADLAMRAAFVAPVEGRALFAANRALPDPDDPWQRLWHATTLLREHRGDGHVAALLAAGINGRESHVVHALATGIPADVYAAARNLQPGEWDALVAGLRVRGLVDAAGLTPRGKQLKAEIERRTDDLAATAFVDIDTAELIAALRPIARAVVDSGEIPLKTPTGIDLTELA